MLKQPDQALVWWRHANDAAPDYPSIYAPLAAALALAGHEQDARVMLATYLSLKAHQGSHHLGVAAILPLSLLSRTLRSI